MKLGYLIIAILYIILSLININLSKSIAWIYVAFALVYAGLAEAVDYGVKLD